MSGSNLAGITSTPSGCLPSYDVFLSYNSHDHSIVEDIANQLRDQGINPFLDRWYLGPGLRWRPRLEETLNGCRAIAVFLGPDGMGSWQQREVDVALDRQSKDPSFAVVPVLLAGCEPPLGFLRQNTWVDFRGQTKPPLVILAKAIRGESPGPDLKDQFAATRASLCPYRGLMYFREEDSPFFFGREIAVNGLVAAVRQHHFLAVVGASGSGKSSVVRAGLLPHLRRERGITWEILTLVPGDQPLKALAAALLPFLEPGMTETDRLAEVGKLSGHFASGTVSLQDVIHRILDKQMGTERLLLVVDQWEELYTLTSDVEARRQFIDQLLDASIRGPLTVVLTLRGDFVGDALAYRPLCDRLQGTQINLGPMTRVELMQAVTKPAGEVGLDFEPGLVERILDDAGDEPGSLPLLEFVLRRLWEDRDHGQLLHCVYERIGGLQGAVANEAERFHSTLTDPEQVATQRLFLQLVRPGQLAEDTRRRERLDDIPQSSKKVVNRLVDARLLVAGKSPETGEVTLEVAHEALIHHWQRFKDWLTADREFLLWRERLRIQITEWDHAGNSDETLLRGPILIEAERWIQQYGERLTSHEQEFIAASYESRNSRRRARKVTVVYITLVSLLSILAVGAILYYSSRNQAIAVAKVSQKFTSLMYDVVVDMDNKGMAIGPSPGTNLINPLYDSILSTLTTETIANIDSQLRPRMWKLRAISEWRAGKFSNSLASARQGLDAIARQTTPGDYSDDSVSLAMLPGLIAVSELQARFQQLGPNDVRTNYTYYATGFHAALDLLARLSSDTTATISPNIRYFCHFQSWRILEGWLYILAQMPLSEQERGNKDADAFVKSRLGADTLPEAIHVNKNAIPEEHPLRKVIELQTSR